MFIFPCSHGQLEYTHTHIDYIPIYIYCIYVYVLALFKKIYNATIMHIKLFVGLERGYKLGCSTYI